MVPRSLPAAVVLLNAILPAGAAVDGRRPLQHDLPHDAPAPAAVEQHHLIPSGTRSLQGEPLPATVVMEQQLDAQQVLLVQITNDGTATDVFQTACGTDTFYEYGATVLGVTRTVDPGATAIGAETEGEVMQVCDELTFKTYEKEWPEGGCPDAEPDPGRVDEGACGTIYLTPGPVAGGPYVLAVKGKGFFVPVEDQSVCDELMKQCEVVEMMGSGAGDGDDAGAASKNGAGIVSIGGSVVAALLSAVALWRH